MSIITYPLVTVSTFYFFKQQANPLLRGCVIFFTQNIMIFWDTLQHLLK